MGVIEFVETVRTVQFFPEEGYIGKEDRKKRQVKYRMDHALYEK